MKFHIEQKFIPTIGYFQSVMNIYQIKLKFKPIKIINLLESNDIP